MIAAHARGVFISYRRIDACPYARMLQVRLGEHLPGTPLFMDLDSIEAGVDFAEAITAGLDACCVLIALIGPRWLAAADSECRRSLDTRTTTCGSRSGPRCSAASALSPVPVDGAEMPLRPATPGDLAKLARLNHLEVSYDRYEYDESRLISITQKTLAAAETAETTQWPPGSPPKPPTQPTTGARS